MLDCPASFLYAGGNLVVGKRSEAEVVSLFRTIRLRPRLPPKTRHRCGSCRSSEGFAAWRFQALKRDSTASNATASKSSRTRWRADSPLRKQATFSTPFPQRRFPSVAYVERGGRPLFRPRGGFPLFDAQHRLTQQLSEAGADFIPLTIDSYTRHNQYETATQLLRRERGRGKELPERLPAREPRPRAHARAISRPRQAHQPAPWNTRCAAAG